MGIMRILGRVIAGFFGIVFLYGLVINYSGGVAVIITYLVFIIPCFYLAFSKTALSKLRRRLAYEHKVSQEQKQEEEKIEHQAYLEHLGKLQAKEEFYHNKKKRRW